MGWGGASVAPIGSKKEQFVEQFFTHRRTYGQKPDRDLPRIFIIHSPTQRKPHNILLSCHRQSTSACGLNTGLCLLHIVCRLLSVFVSFSGTGSVVGQLEIHARNCINKLTNPLNFLVFCVPLGRILVYTRRVNQIKSKSYFKIFC